MKKLIVTACLLITTAFLLGCEESKSSSSSSDDALEMFSAFDNPAGSTTAARNASQEVFAAEFFNPNTSRSYVVKTLDLEAVATDKANSGWLSNTGANSTNIRVFVGTEAVARGTAVAFGTDKKVTVTLTNQIVVAARTSVRVKFLVNTTGASIQNNNNDTFALKVVTASVEITGATNPSTPLVGPPIVGNTFAYTS